MTKTNRGFTLVEAMAVIAIIGILVVLAGPTFTTAMRQRQVNKFAHDVASVIYQARATAMIKRRDIQVSYQPGFILVLSRDDQNVIMRYPADPDAFYDPGFSIVANDNRSFINANGFVIDGNGHPLTKNTIQIVDATTGYTVSFFMNYAGSVDWN